MENILTIKANLRDNLGRQVKNVRAQGGIPAVLYGNNFKNLNLTFDKKEFDKVYTEAGTSTLVNLEVTNHEGLRALIHEPQKDPVTGNILHVDLYKVDMQKEIHTEIPLEFVGISPAVADLEGNLITNKDAVEVKCLPDKLVSEIQIDISALKTFDDSIKVSDIKVPEGIELLAEPEEIIALVTAPRSEAELEEMEQESTAEAEKVGIESIEAKAEEEKAEKETDEETAEVSIKDEKK